MDDKSTQKPKSRKDVSEKKKERAKNEQKVVKCFLQSVIIDKENVDSILRSIEERVIAFSQRQVIASIGLNLIIQELFNNVALEDIKDVQIPDILDITFIRQLLLGTNNAKIVSKEVEQLYKLNPCLLKVIQSIPRHQGDRNIYSAGAIKYQTNIHNHFWTNIKKRTWRFIKEFIPKEHKNVVMRHLMNWKTSSDDEGIIQNLSKYQRQLIQLQKEILGEEQITESWCKNRKNFERLVRHSVFVSRLIDKKQFSIVPMSKLKRHYISIDTSTLYGIMKEIGIYNGNEVIFTSLKDDQWKSVFNVRRVQGKHCRFTYTIETDGVGVSIHFERPKKVMKSPKQLSFNDLNTEYWACDPGRTNIYYMVKKNEDGTVRKLRLTRKQYYKESGISKAIKRSNKWLQNSTIQQADLSSYSSKGCSLQKFQAFVYNCIANWNNLWNELSSKKWSVQKMKLYGGKKRVFARFLNKVHNPDKKVVIGYGSAKFNPTSKGELSAPVSRAYKECTFRFKTVLVDEFRTSKVYYGDGNTILEEVRTKANKTVRGLLWYSSTIKGSNKFVNRDLNASINILNCFVNPTRPTMLCRSDKNEKIVQRVGNIIFR
jgi:hypothetical protein